MRRLEKETFFHQLDARTEITYADNGLKICRVKFPNAHMRLCNVKVNFGSRDIRLHSGDSEKVLPYGTAHFLEHVLFWHNGRNLYSDFFDHGALLNAFTTYTDTNFMFTSLPDRLGHTIPKLLDALWNPSFEENIVAQEKSVIKSEIETAHLNQQLHYHYQMLNLLSPASPAAIFPAGRTEDIEALTINDLKEAYATSYQPHRMTMFLIGGSEDTETILPSHPRLRGRSGHTAKRKFMPACPPLLRNQSLGDAECSGETWTGLHIGALPDKNDLFTLQMYWDIVSRVLFHIDSPLFQEIRQTRLLNIQSLSAESHVSEDGGFLILHSKGAHSSAYIDVAANYVMQQKCQAEAWLEYGKESLLNAIIYDSDYVRKCFEWAAECERYDCSFFELYRLIQNMTVQDFLYLIDTVASAKKATIHVSHPEVVGQ